MALEWAAFGGSRNSGLKQYAVAGIASQIISTAGAGSWITSLLSDASLAKTTGLWVWEFTYAKYVEQTIFLGVGSAADLPASGTYAPASGKDTVALYLGDGKMWNNTLAVPSGPGATAFTGYSVSNLTSQVYTFIINAGTRKLWIKHNGTYIFDAAGDPAAGTNEILTIAGTGALEPMISLLKNVNGELHIHQPNEIQYPVSGATPLGFEAATITFASGAITDAAGNAVTESGVIASVCDRATGAQIATTTANVSGGAATLNITADVTNGQAVVVHFHNASGTFKAGGFLTTVAV